MLLFCMGSEHVSFNRSYKVYFCVGRSTRPIDAVSILLLLSLVIYLNGTVKSQSDRPTEVSPMPKLAIDFGKFLISVSLRYLLTLLLDPLIFLCKLLLGSRPSPGARSLFSPYGDWVTVSPLDRGAIPHSSIQVFIISLSTSCPRSSSFGSYLSSVWAGRLSQP